MWRNSKSNSKSNSKARVTHKRSIKLRSYHGVIAIFLNTAALKKAIRLIAGGHWDCEGIIENAEEVACFKSMWLALLTWRMFS